MIERLAVRAFADEIERRVAAQDSLNEHRLFVVANGELLADKNANTHLPGLVVQLQVLNFADAHAGAPHGSARTDAGRVLEAHEVDVMAFEHAGQTAEQRDE